MVSARGVRPCMRQNVPLRFGLRNVTRILLFSTRHVWCRHVVRLCVRYTYLVISGAYGLLRRPRNVMCNFDCELDAFGVGVSSGLACVKCNLFISDCEPFVHIFDFGLDAFGVGVAFVFARFTHPHFRLGLQTVVCILIIGLDVFGVSVVSDFARPTSTSSSRAPTGCFADRGTLCAFLIMTSTCLASAWRPILRASNLPLRIGLRSVMHILIIRLDIVGAGVVSHLACIKCTSSSRAAKRVHAPF